MKTSSNPESPLAGQTILVTRPAAQADSLGDQLVQLGAKVVFHPVIEILPPENWQDVDRVIRDLEFFQTIVFVSRNGVEHFVGRVHETNRMLALANLKVLSIGAGTSTALAKFDISATTISGKSDSDSVADQLAATNAEQPILVVRADRGSSVLPDRLTDANLKFSQIVAYHSVDRSQADPAVVKSLAAGEIDWVTVTSSAIGRSVVGLFGDHLAKTNLVSISPTTSIALKASGHLPAAEAKKYDMAGIVSAILDHVQDKP